MSGLQLSKGRVVTVFLSQGTVDGGPPGKQPALSVTEAPQNSAEVTVSSSAKLALPPASSRAKLALPRADHRERGAPTSANAWCACRQRDVPSIGNRPEVGRGYPLNLSILLSGGKETNQDSISNGE